MRACIARLGLLVGVLTHAVDSPAQNANGDTIEPSLAAAIRRCTSQRDKGQTLKVDGHWLKAHGALKACAAQDCPMAIRSECRSWVSELEAQIPSVVFVIEGPAEPSVARVFVTGETSEQAFAPEVPIRLEPGDHSFRVEVPNYPAKKLTLTLRAGEQHRLVRVRFGPESVGSDAAIPDRLAQKPARTAALPSAEPRFLIERPVPWLSYGLGMAALASVVTASGLYAAARADMNNARATCAPHCPAARRESIDRMYLLSDVAGLGALLFGAAASYFYVTRPQVRRPANSYSGDSSMRTRNDTKGLAVPQFFAVVDSKGTGLWVRRSF